MSIKDVNRFCLMEDYKKWNKALRGILVELDQDMVNLVFDNILDNDKGNGPLQNIDDILEGKDLGGINPKDGPWYNTFPFGTPTDETYSRYLAVCRGKMLLRTVLSAVKKQSKLIAEKFGNDASVTKTVIVLTDKWDTNIFQRFEKVFLKHAALHGIWYIFLLVTDYGYTQIPFLPNNRYAQKKLAFEYNENELTKRKMQRLLQDMPVLEYRTNGGSWNHLENYSFTVDLFDYTWTKRFDPGLVSSRSETPGITSGIVHEDAMRRFLESVMWIKRSPERKIAPKIHGAGAESHSLDIFGKHVEWDGAASSENGEERFKDLQRMIERFIRDCEKWSHKKSKEA